MAKLSEGVSNAVTVLMASDPFHAAMLVNMDLFETDDSRVTPTAKTDGYRKIWLNSEFMASMSAQQGAFVIAHEIGHKVLQHPARALDILRKKGKLSPLVFNIAGDFHINKFLADSGYSLPPGDTNTYAEIKAQLAGTAEPKAGYLFDNHLPRDADTEWLYEDLLSVLPPPPPQSGKGQPQEPCDGGQGQEQGQGQGEPQPGDGEPQPGDGEPQKGGGLGESGAGAEDMDLDEYKKTIEAEGVTPEQAAEQTKTDIASAAMSARDRGSIPGHVQGLLDQMNKPTKDWRAQLRRFMGGLARDDFSYRRPNRRSAGSTDGIIQPSLYSERPGTVAIIVDTSGSVADKELAQGLAEISSIAKRVKPQRVLVISCDTKVNAVDSYRAGQKITTLKTNGRGGTCMNPAFAYLKEKNIRPDCIICFTDGELMHPDRKDVCAPVLWAICNPSNEGAHTVPYGRHIEIVVKD